MDKRNRIFVLGLWLLAVSLCCAVSPLVVASDQGWAAAERVSLTRYNTFLNNLSCHDGNNRRVIPKILGEETPDHHNARDYIRAQFITFGFPEENVVVEEYPDVVAYLLQYNVWNVVATKPGIVHGDQQYIVGAHYDSYNRDSLFGSLPAPGADDNASGVALVLEAARVLAPYSSDYTIKFVIFDFEEHGDNDGYPDPIGSRLYVERHGSDDIRGMISADMVAYNTPDNLNHACIFGRKESYEIKNALAAAVTEYGDGLSCRIHGRDDASDHYAFEKQGIQACMLAEGADETPEGNPHYHHADDSYEQGELDLAYATKMTRSVVGYLVDAAGVDFPALRFTYPNGRPRFVDPRGCTRMLVQVSGVGGLVPLPDTGWFSWCIPPNCAVGPMEEVSDNLYEAVFPSAMCGDTIYYSVSAQAVGGDTYYDPNGGSFDATVAYGRRVIREYLRDDTCPAWTYYGLWGCGHPTGQGGQHGHHDPTAGHTGLNVIGYNLDGDYQDGLGETHVISDAIECSGAYGVHLDFWRWLGVEAPGFDHASISVSPAGGPWQTVWENTSEIDDRAWHEMDVDISYVADNQSFIYVRWTMGPTDGSWTYCGWNIDDVRVTAINYVLGDMNCDGVLDGLDVQPFVDALIPHFSTEFPSCSVMNGDINCSGMVDIDDITGFVACLLNGGCP